VSQPAPGKDSHSDTMDLTRPSSYDARARWLLPTYVRSTVAGGAIDRGTLLIANEKIDSRSRAGETRLAA
jgi:hypothetical protein